jgi:integrase
VLTAAFTGLRWGEALGLRANRLDLAGGRLTVHEALSKVCGELTFRAPKTGASRRTVALPGALVEELRAHLAQWPAVGNGLVFTGTEGLPYGVPISDAGSGNRRSTPRDWDRSDFPTCGIRTRRS